MDGISFLYYSIISLYRMIGRRDEDPMNIMS